MSLIFVKISQQLPNASKQLNWAHGGQKGIWFCYDSRCRTSLYMCIACSTCLGWFSWCLPFNSFEYLPIASRSGRVKLLSSGGLSLPMSLPFNCLLLW